MSNNFMLTITTYNYSAIRNPLIGRGHRDIFTNYQSQGLALYNLYLFNGEPFMGLGHTVLPFQEKCNISDQF